MRKIWLSAALLLVVILSACSGAGKSAVPTTAAAAPMDCTLSSVFPEGKDPAAVKLPAVTDADWVRGAKNPRITLVEYSDFQCPYCAEASRSLRDFEAAHPDEVQVIFRHFPLPSHDKAELAAQAAEAAGLQGKFWEMHDLLFSEGKWETWTPMSVDNFQTWIVDQAQTLGLDSAKFTADLTSEAVVNKVTKAYGSAISSDLNSTPSLFFFAGDQLVFTPADQVPYDKPTLEIVLTLAKLRAREYKACPPMVIDPAKKYTATIKTSQGDFTVKLYAKQAPLAVNSFVFLAREGWFNNVSWHRVLPDFVAQTGDPTGTGFGGPGYLFKNEVSDALKFDREGLLGMANSGKDTNGSQFFVTYKATPDLDGSYTVFGEVTQGMDVVKKLTPRDPSKSGDLPTPDTILSVTIEEN